ncbi:MULTISPECIES: hypothetical protein [unclassified Arthrobacter]|uniref:hypothetical protein n=1 Tax=unclassified Arthrobacter TaxID=235627 RepID=UPI002106DBAF|nr:MULTISPECIES: hypothetical protein [unclassified Arthrobacter]MCQ1945510.1 hypothetical protein [Arthrobacter sp. zg-Y1116]MCQ1994829.1 hypothetical protein [Arthrobacter sp. zg-Y1171]UWX81104.1 hypothetical protein N2L00_11915 [Arthrobacter sp. zg-Y1171]
MTTAPETAVTYSTVDTPRDAIDLAAFLCHPERDHPVVVISSTKDGPRIDPAAVAGRLGNKATVYLLATPAVAYPFDEAMPEETSVYGGAARSYPTGNAWHSNQRISVLRLAYADAEARDAVDLLAQDVDKMDPYAPPVTTSSTPARSTVPQVVGCEVSMLLPPDGVLVKLAHGMARIDTATLAPGIEPERLFTPGQKLTGTVQNGLLTITSGIHTVAEAVAHAPAGTIHPALVLNEKRIALFPGLVVRHTSPREPGSVIAVRVELSGRADGKGWKFSTAEDPEPESITPALPFYVGDEPWIVWSPRAAQPVEIAESDEPAEPKPGPEGEEHAPTQDNAPAAADDGETPPSSAPPAAAHTDVTSALELIRTTLHDLDETNRRLEAEATALRHTASNQKSAGPVPSPGPGGAALDQAQRQVALLTRERIELVGDLTRALGDADTLAAENTALAHENERLRESVRTEQTRAARARQLSREISAGADTGPLFADPAEQFRHDVYLEWATRIPAASKAETPLAEYGFTEKFLQTVDRIQGVDRSKIVAVVVEVLTGIADTSAGRDMHRLRGGPKAGTGFIEDAEYGTAWRVALQVATASARRLHFWRGTDGKVMFATVGVHDDMGI